MASLAAMYTDIIYTATRYGLSTLFALGIIGSLLNIVLFSRRHLRQISCCTYFLAASCANLISLSWGIIPSLYTLNNIYPGSYSIIFCKMQGYLTHTSLQMTRIFLVLACFDRYALSSSNANIRKFSQVIIARRSIPIVVLSCLLIAIHLIIYLDIKRNACSLYNTSVMIYNSLYSMITISILIPILMFIFSILTFYNLKSRQQQRLQLRQSIDQQIKRDQKVLFVLLMQLVLYFLSTVLYAPIFIYATITQTIEKSFERQIIESFISALALSLIYLYPALSFFAFTLTSKTFRKELLHLFSYSHRLQRIRIEPLTIITQKSRQNLPTF